MDHVALTIAEHLKERYGCHTALLYGSRARGSITSTSDYDVLGVCARGARTRLARKVNGVYWDVFVYPEKELRTLGDAQLGWKDAIVIFERGDYGRRLVKRIQKNAHRPYQPEPAHERAVLKVWAQKEIDRCRVADIHGLYRRAELLNAAIEHYFVLRKKRFWGPKAGIQWLEKHDPASFRLYHRALSSPEKMVHLQSLTERFYLLPKEKK